MGFDDPEYNRYRKDLDRMKLERFNKRMNYTISIFFVACFVFFLYFKAQGDNQSRFAQEQNPVLQPNQKSGQQASTSPAYQQLPVRGILLQSDRSGFYRGTARINNIPVPFLIDTGANLTVIPNNFAISAGLPFGKTVNNSTVGGVVQDNLTRIDSLRIGNAEIKNLTATINQHMQYALIGMNALKYFQISQADNAMVLQPYNNLQEAFAFQSQNPDDFHFYDIQLDWNQPGAEWNKLQMDGKDCLYQHKNALETISCKEKQQRRMVYLELDTTSPGLNWKALEMDGKNCFYQNRNGFETISCRDRS